MYIFKSPLFKAILFVYCYLINYIICTLLLLLSYVKALKKNVIVAAGIYRKFIVINVG